MECWARVVDRGTNPVVLHPALSYRALSLTPQCIIDRNCGVGFRNNLQDSWMHEPPVFSMCACSSLQKLSTVAAADSFLVHTHPGSAHELLQGLPAPPRGQAGSSVYLQALGEGHKLSPKNSLIKVSSGELRASLLIFIFPLGFCDSGWERNGILFSA